MDYVSMNDSNGINYEIMEWIPRMASDYGWTSGKLDTDMAQAIEKARKAQDEEWCLFQSLAKSRFSYEAMRFCQGERSAEKIHAGGAYEGEEILAIRKPV